MSSPRYSWWGYVKSMIRKYPERRERLEDLQAPKVTAVWDDMPKGKGTVGRPIEELALVSLPPVEQKEFDAVDRAIRFTNKLKDGSERLKVIKLVFWGGYTLQNAAMQIPCSYDTAQNWHRDFIRKVAENFGLL